MDSELVSALQESGRRVLADQCDSQALHQLLDKTVAAGSAAAHDAALWQTAGELGWLGIAVPEAHGGLDAGIAGAAVLQEEQGQRLAPIPFLSTTLVARALADWPCAATQEKWLPALASGAAIGGIAANGGPLSATRNGDGWRVSGTCEAVLGGDAADVLLVPVEADGGAGLALLERSDGIATTPLPVADMTRGVARVVCADIALPATRLLTGAAAATLADRLADEARILVASDAIGGSAAILDATVEYLKTRVQFGKPIGTFQALKHRCADHKLTLETSRRLLAQAIARIDAPDRGVWAALAKFAACDGYAALAGDAVQLHGGIGFTWEHDAHLFLKRALLDQFLFGGSAETQDRAAALLIAGAGR